ncbi:MAG: hypothetical protein ACYC6M_11960 [Terriglobales bacterium]
MGVVLCGAVSLLGQAPVVPATPSAAATVSSIGVIVGPAVRLEGAVAMADGKLTVESGTEVHVASGEAKLTLTRGGYLRFCGPLQATLVAGPQESLLVTLGHGALELRFPAHADDSLLTADFRVTPVSPPGQVAAISANLELEKGGTLCVENHGTPLAVSSLWGNESVGVIAGMPLRMTPGMPSVAVAGCGCRAVPPPAVAAAPARADGGAAPLFPAAAGLTYSAADESAVPAAPVQRSAPQPRKRGNFLTRFFRRLFKR